MHAQRKATHCFFKPRGGEGGRREEEEEGEEERSRCSQQHNVCVCRTR